MILGHLQLESSGFAIAAWVGADYMRLKFPEF
jgi:hypothetical protein